MNTIKQLAEQWEMTIESTNTELDHIIAEELEPHEKPTKKLRQRVARKELESM